MAEPPAPAEPGRPGGAGGTGGAAGSGGAAGAGAAEAARGAGGALELVPLSQAEEPGPYGGPVVPGVPRGHPRASATVRANAIAAFLALGVGSSRPSTLERGLPGTVRELPVDLWSTPRALRPRRGAGGPGPGVQKRRDGGGGVGGPPRALLTRELSRCLRARRGGTPTRQVRQAFGGRVPGALEEENLASAVPQGVDKIFAACWTSPRKVLAGTKCNALLEFDTEARTCRHVELPATPSLSEYVRLAGPGGAGHRLFTRGDRCGIHTVAANPSRTLVSTGGRNPCDCVVLDPISHRHACTLVGHSDWVFDSDWISDTRLLTAGRDGVCKVWDVGAGGRTLGATATMEGHCPGVGPLPFDAVRAAKYCRDIGRAASLGQAGGRLWVWDPGCLQAGQPAGGLDIRLPTDAELVCLSVRRTLIAVGSQSHLLLVDTRVGGTVKCVTAMHSDDCGIRSLCLLEDVLSLGSGMGGLSFFDLRRDAFLRVDGGDPEGRPGPWPGGGEGRRHPYCLALNQTSMEDADDTYARERRRPACLCHSWDPSATRIFAAGGPISYHNTGCYAAVWA